MVKTMLLEPEVSIITGRITEVGTDYIYVWPGTRVMLMPNVATPHLSPIQLEATSDRPWLTPSSG